MKYNIYKKFTPSELRHYSKRADIYALDKEKSILRSSAWKISNNENLKRSEKKNLDISLKRIAKIPKLSTTCINQDCEKCEKIKSLLGVKSKKTPYKLNLELYRWQKECKNKWKDNGGEGIVKVVTGAGKTILALSLIEYLNEIYQNKKLKTLIIVPKTALLDQWVEEITEKLNVPEEEIGSYYGENKDDIEENNIMIYVVNSARKYLSQHLNKVDDDIFLIVDECHRVGSKENRKIFKKTFDYKLGISATPERRSDYAFEKVLTKEMGKIIYTYYYSEGRRDGIIPPYRLIRVAVPLTGVEVEEYEKLTKKIRKTVKILMNRYPELENIDKKDFFKELGRLENKYNDKMIKKYTLLTNQRKSIVHTSKSKIACLKHLIKNRIDTRARILIFHERTKIANKIHGYLKENNLESTIYHTGLSVKERRKNLRKYRNKKENILVTCKALDEGLDVPDTSVGIIAAATSSVRQRVQRIGRILRKSPRKDYSEIYTIYISGIEEKIFKEKDMKDLEKSAEKIQKIKMEFS